MLSTPTSTKASREAARKRRRAEREAARPGARSAAAKQPEGWRETLRFWFWAILIVLVLRAFLFEPFRIPTPSMENTLLVGDFLFVSKLHYGARTPNTIGIPFTGVFISGLELPQTRLPGFSDVERGDVAVFNYPPDVAPVERKTPYIKRIVGIPGDTVSLLDKELYVNGDRYELTETQQQSWVVTPSQNVGIPRAQLDEVGAELLGTIPGTTRIVVNGPPEAADAIRAWPYVASVEGYAIPEGRSNGPMFPEGAGFNRDTYGPLAVPAAGQTVRLTDETWPALRDLITRYEGHRAEALGNGRFRIDGEAAETYTFGQDYYFVMGDNRDNSQDSRFWGFVPDDHLVGKAVLIFFSLDMEDRLLGLIPTPRLRGLQPIR